MDPPNGPGWERDPDVLDTWFSQRAVAVRDARLARRDRRAEGVLSRPTCCSTARDILFLWVARMVFMGLEFAGDIPFDDVYVHSVVQAPDGRRMSKSLGTGIDPLTLIDGGPRPPVFTEGGEFPAYGADAVRYGLLAMSSHAGRALQRGHDRRGPPARQQAVQRVAARAAARARGRRRCRTPAPAPATVEDTWILSRLQAAEADVARGDRGLRVPPRDAARCTRFVYGELCDWYLEMLKPRLYAEDNAATAEFALHVLAETLALAHPVIPFVTEEIWSLTCPAPSDLLMGHRWPEADEALRDAEVEAEVAARDRGHAGAADLARRRARGAGRARAGAARRDRLRARGRARRAARALRVLRQRRRAGRDGRRARRRRWRCSPSDAVDIEAEKQRAAERAERAARARSRASRASSPTRASWPRRPRQVVQAERDKLEKLQAGAGRALMSVRGTSAEPRSTCSRSSCSACASAWSACAGC